LKLGLESRRRACDDGRTGVFEAAMQTRVVVTMLAPCLAACLAACSSGGDARPEHTAAYSTEETGMELTSPAFAPEAAIPDRYTCEGSDVSPPLQFTNVPTDTVSLTLVMDDPDAPVGVWDHWVEFDIPPRESIPEAAADLGTPGTNSWDRTGYGGPCPPSGTHRYFFTVYALDSELGLPAGATKAEVLDALEGHILAQATLMGLYSR
jgi:Raf kinase inhibitor-like YbhB/YbcL family protein